MCQVLKLTSNQPYVSASHILNTFVPVGGVVGYSMFHPSLVPMYPSENNTKLELHFTSSTQQSLPILYEYKYYNTLKNVLFKIYHDIDAN